MRTQANFRTEKSSYYKFLSNIAESNFTMTLRSKLILIHSTRINLLMFIYVMRLVSVCTIASLFTVWYTLANAW